MLYGKWHEQRSHRVKWGLPIAVGLASLAAFSIGYVPMSAIECFEFPYHDLKQYAVFDGVLIGRAAGLFTGNTIDQISLFKLVPALVLFGLQIIAVIFVSSNIIRKNSVPKGSLAILFLCLFSLFFQTFSAIGRVCGGVSYAMSSRYVSYSVPGLIGVLFFLVQRWEFKFSSFTKGVVMAIALLAMVKEGRVLKRDAPFYNWYADGKTRWVECYKKTHDAKGCIQKEQFTVHPAPDDTHLTDKLNFLEAHKLNLFLD